VGVLGAVEAVRSLQAGGHRPRRPVEVIAFAGEEPRFGTGCIGSRALMGRLSRTDLDTLVDRDGISLAQALSAFGLDPDRVPEAHVDPATVHAFVELHIEQAIVLETHGEPIGVVEAIAAPHDFRVTLRGAATHAGATPMALRRDALAAAAEAMLALERIARASSSATTVATVGVIRARPGAINVVPGEVELDVDVRDSDEAAREVVIGAFVSAMHEIATARGVAVEIQEIVVDTPTPCAANVVAAAVGGCEALGLSHRRMISGAYHDAMIVGSEIPMGMVFVPSRGGVSHHPDEYTSPEQIDQGVDVLASMLAELAA
jgi:ureidoglycolate amidohydrolase